MTSSIITNPEVGRVYLVRRKINGKLTNRFQPARIMAREFDSGEAVDLVRFVGYRICVKWINDGTTESDIFEVHGHVRELTKRQLDIELNAAAAAADIAQNRFDDLCALKIQLKNI